MSRSAEHRPVDLMALLRSLLRPDSVGSTVAIVTLGSALSLAMFSLAARYLGPVEFGLFATWFNAASFAAVVALIGQETLIVRSWNEYLKSGRYGLAKGALRFGLMVNGAGIVIALAAILAGWMIFGWPAWLTLASAALVVMQSVGLYSCHAGRAVVGIWTGDGHGQITWRAITICLIAVAWLYGMAVSAAGLIAAIAAAIAISLIIQASVTIRHVPQEVSAAKARFDTAGWTKRARHMWGAAILEASSQYLDVLLVGILLGPVAAGGFFVATRIANVFLKALSSSHIYSSRTISELYYSNRRPELRERLRSLSLFNLAVVGLGLVAVLAGGKLMLLVFGNTYAEQYPSLVVLCLATAFMALAGPAPTLLMLVGRERIYMWGVAIGLALRMLLLSVLAPQFGVFGAAMAWSLAAVVTAVGLNIVCRRSVGLDPSCLNLIERKAQGERS